MESDLAQDIKSSDERTFGERVKRYEFFFTLPEPKNGLWLDQPECSMLIDEAFWCYINGEFIACILLCQITLETLLRIQTKSNDMAQFKEIIDTARLKKLIDDEEQSSLHMLRNLRNKFTHIKSITNPNSLWKQRIQDRKNEYEQADNAAQLALKIMFGILSKPPFAL